MKKGIALRPENLVFGLNQLVLNDAVGFGMSFEIIQL
jgi:hypothetical protein